MAAQQVLQQLEIDLDRSPACKRARYDLDPNESVPWTLTKNELVLHSVYDSGVGRLESDSENEIVRKPRKKKMYKKKPVSNPEEIAILQASLPENTLQQLSMKELDNLLLARNSNSLISDNINYFNYLSDEVILQIFQNFTKAELANTSLVCRRFNQLAQDESLWTRMDVSNRTLEQGAVGKMISRQVIILRLSKSHINYPPILPDVKAGKPDYNSRLMYLDLTMATVSTSSLIMIFQKCVRLKKLSLESVPINNEVLYALSGSKDLEIVNLAMASGIEIEGLKHLLENCKNIKELNLSWTCLSSECINHICEYLPRTLDRLNLSGCRKLLKDNNVTSLVKNCCHLRELDLSDCTAITGDSVRQITALEKLNFLALSRCYAIPYRSLLHLKHIKDLTFLDVHGSYIDAEELKIIKDGLGSQVVVNQFKFSSIARPTVGIKKWIIWGMKLRE